MQLVCLLVTFRHNFWMSRFYSVLESDTSVRRCRLVQAGLVRCNEGPGGMLGIMIETANSGTKKSFQSVTPLVASQSVSLETDPRTFNLGHPQGQQLLAKGLSKFFYTQQPCFLRYIPFPLQ